MRARFCCSMGDAPAIDAIHPEIGSSAPGETNFGRRFLAPHAGCTHLCVNTRWVTLHVVLSLANDCATLFVTLPFCVLFGFSTSFSQRGLSCVFRSVQPSGSQCTPLDR